MPGAGTIRVSFADPSATVSRHVQDPETGRMIGRISVACEKAAEEAAALIALKAQQNLGVAFPNSYGVTAHADGDTVRLSGQWAEAAERGTRPHVIAPHGDYPMRSGGPAAHSGGPGELRRDLREPVGHPGTDASHSLERAGDGAYFLGKALLVEHLP